MIPGVNLEGVALKNHDGGWITSSRTDAKKWLDEKTTHSNSSAALFAKKKDSTLSDEKQDLGKKEEGACESDVASKITQPTGQQPK